MLRLSKDTRAGGFFLHYVLFACVLRGCSDCVVAFRLRGAAGFELRSWRPAENDMSHQAYEASPIPYANVVFRGETLCSSSLPHVSSLY